MNALGWAYRLCGDIQKAEIYYWEARRKCILEGGLERDELKEDYGWISNNLAFVLSENKETREQAMDIGRDAIKHWQSIGHDIGLGAAFLVLGNSYYRDGRRSSALEAYEKALEIFKLLEHYDWLGRIYSWRGILYLDLNQKDPNKYDLEKAEKELIRSLEIGSQDIRAMMLNRLGRVYMRQGKWQEAEKCMQESFELAQKLPDYRYWIASLARLFSIATELGQHKKLDEYHKLLEDCPEIAKKSYKYDLGLGYIGLTKLSFIQENPDKKTIIAYLKHGISLLVESESYAHSNISGRLELIEKDFYKINPLLIRSIGQKLEEYSSKKSSQHHNVCYNKVTEIMHRWANWKKEEKIV
ncbi:tetratricopeptide repeat domain protein [Candidatus Moduliflexus flocculans]|uniref:Tetratricopeptide repeat domain protein n=1 Tax=Candidatus Moduliflexus flocculans TaxID=1499966 RepID=A0A081BS23_9BACT|nr:tetratricopeptide repeat domain protein [Candidatus Moduliflexus flocculans]